MEKREYKRDRITFYPTHVMGLVGKLVGSNGEYIEKQTLEEIKEFRFSLEEYLYGCDDLNYKERRMVFEELIGEIADIIVMDIQNILTGKPNRIALELTDMELAAIRKFYDNDEHEFINAVIQHKVERTKSRNKEGYYEKKFK